MNTIIECLNALGARFTGFALPMLVQSGVLISLLFALDLALRKRVSATTRYAVWMLALVKLALPPSLASPTSVAYWLGSYFAPISASVADEIHVKYNITGPIQDLGQETAPPVLNSNAILFVVWLAVAVGFGIWCCWRLRGVVSVIRRSAEAPPEARALLDSCRQQLGIKRVLPVRCAAIPSPAICGV